jgi:hypothetical protein
MSRPIDAKMTLSSTLAAANLLLSVACVLLATAPFPGALLLFVIWVPLAAYVARMKQVKSALSVPCLAALAWLLSPIKFDHANIFVLGLWLAWVLAWSAVLVYFSRKTLRQQA